MSYTKLFQSILASTVWAEPDHVRIIWITMLAMANVDGIVEASVPGLAHIARVHEDKCRLALGVLLSPDPDSRNPANEGRRIEKVDGGWLILNYEEHRYRSSLEHRREQNRVRQSRFRHARNAKSLQAEAEAEAEAEQSTERAGARHAVVKRPESVSEQVWNDWLRHRKEVRAAVTATVLSGFTREAEKAGIALEAAIAHSITQGWRGFRADWYRQSPGRNGAAPRPVEHMRNMPIPTPSCECSVCAKARMA